MKKTDIKLDDILSAKSEEELTKPFLGKVEKIYENSALLSIIDYDKADKTAVSDLNKKIVVNFKNLKSAPKRKIKEIQALAKSDVKIEKIAKSDLNNIENPTDKNK
ncbi:hypothetical protein SAMN04487792_0521 [Lactobacillus bombicola]|jgi:uncharacterized protein YkvS|uniref:DUF2187 domain-containing protein n=1 Tax=Lactobacillus bombicola TaxID=1505723 RepID=A0A1I1RRN5_9LACO|nr:MULTISPECIES: DUF2187 domain-containing protein [Lactobacillus]MCO6527375.1 DUF2187 domain-containing protein [Lactobacillus sp.]RHW50773.1 DUF2187 domain-containing protein [Lactobacillus bombicola]RHW51621.1 DUF2187 domain-containing protein [Lactobacillus bombicola]RHW54952.1 DUF2187 domain-containing protein [Lactobacillus bombicola]RMC40187.1 DUF2187 domain-containing protein [Lactobacillus sp. ESL0233]